MHEQGGRTVQVNQRGVLQQMQPGGFFKQRADEEVAVAVQQINADAVPGEPRQRLRNFVMQRLFQVVVADPGIKQVAEDVQRFRLGCGIAQKTQKYCRDVRATRTKVQVGKEQDQSASAFSMITSSTGTSWCPPWLPVFTLRIRSITSWPSTTLPNTQ